jgi:uncharacterized lipoprotein YajG
MKRWIALTGAVVLLAACAQSEQAADALPEQPAAQMADTATMADSAAMAGDSMMARDTAEQEQK